jgi:hypothetical protein
MGSERHHKFQPRRMSMEYSQADCAQGSVGGAIGTVGYPSKQIPNSALQQRPPTTFSQLDSAVSDLMELNQRLSSALDRLGHCANEATCSEEKAPPVRLGPDYSRSLRRLRDEISGMRSNINALETHV